MRYTVIGTGAIGGYYGGMLQKSGLSVDFLARSDYEYIKQNGLQIDSYKGNFSLDDVSVFNSSQELPGTDVIIVSTKTTTNASLPELLAPAVGKNTVILVLQNGLGMEDELQKAFPDALIMGGMCFMCAEKKGPGHIIHIDKGSINAAPYRLSDMPILKKIQDDFTAANIEFSVSENLTQARWNKLLWNIPFNGLSVVLEADTKQLMENPYGVSLAKGLMYEVAAGAEACGCPLDTESIDKMIEFTRIMTPYKPSMRVDYDHGRMMEVEYMYRKPIAAAKAKGVRLPYAEMIADQLDFINLTMKQGKPKTV